MKCMRSILVQISSYHKFFIWQGCWLLQKWHQPVSHDLIKHDMCLLFEISGNKRNCWHKDIKEDWSSWVIYYDFRNHHFNLSFILWCFQDKSCSQNTACLFSAACCPRWVGFTVKSVISVGSDRNGHQIQFYVFKCCLNLVTLTVCPLVTNTTICRSKQMPRIWIWPGFGLHWVWPSIISCLFPG